MEKSDFKKLQNYFENIGSQDVTKQKKEKTDEEAKIKKLVKSIPKDAHAVPDKKHGVSLSKEKSAPLKELKEGHVAQLKKKLKEPAIPTSS